MKINDYVKTTANKRKGRYTKDKVEMGHFIDDYVNGWVDINSDLLEILNHKDEIFKFNFVWHHYKFVLTRMLPEVAIHSINQDKRIVKKHYDNKNDLFSWFLGQRMIYTSCYFKDESESLEAAQDNKMNLIAQKMQLKPGETLLDIGCGWGTLVAHMAKHFGVQATGVTIADAGAQWGRQQIKDYGAEGKADIMVMDYREIPRKKYNKISCLEMAEHVGIKNFRKFMQQCYDMLDDDGIFYVQIAGLRERNSLFQKRNREDLVWGLFMNEYIFSGADASMPINWDLRHMEKVGFEVQSVENIGIHYSKTINYWYNNWLSNKAKVIEKYGMETFRIYEIFLAWSVVIAKHGGSSAYQIVCHKNLDKLNRRRYIGKTALGNAG